MASDESDHDYSYYVDELEYMHDELEEYEEALEAEREHYATIEARIKNIEMMLAIMRPQPPH